MCGIVVSGSSIAEVVVIKESHVLCAGSSSLHLLAACATVCCRICLAGDRARGSTAVMHRGGGCRPCRISARLAAPVTSLKVLSHDCFPLTTLRRLMLVSTWVIASSWEFFCLCICTSGCNVKVKALHGSLLWGHSWSTVYFWSDDEKLEGVGVWGKPVTSWSLILITPKGIESVHPRKYTNPLETCVQ